MNDYQKEMLKGAYDLHIHFGPDYMPRKCTEDEMAERFLAAGMKGFAIKSHFTPTVERAELVNRRFPGLHAVGGVVLNTSVGGLNPMAVEVAGKLGGKIVWFPTMDAAHDRPRLEQNIPMFVEMQTKLEKRKIMRSAIRILDDEGKLVPEVCAVLEIIRDYDMAAATGHISPREGMEVVKKAREMGIRKVIVTHADWKATNYTVDQQAEAIRLGAIIEHCFMTPCIPYEQIAEEMHQLGPEHFYLSTDLGASRVPGGKNNGFLMSGEAPFADEGMAAFVQIMHDNGFTDAEIRRMVAENPAMIAES